VGFELEAFLGRVSDLRAWKERLPSVRVCVLSGELGMVPLTGNVSQEMRAVRSSPEREEAVRGWGAEASRASAVAFVSLGEFGNQSHEEVTVWSRGREVLTRVPLRTALDDFRDRAAIELGDTPFDLERHRGEDAADKWAAEGE
jgi:hypothetical protein